MKEIDFIEKALGELAEYVREKYAQRDRVAVSSKSHAMDLLTEVDLGVQDRLVAMIAKTFPGDAVAAEERDFGVIPSDPNSRCWVIDPIDGTQNFVRGLFPTFGISVAFAQGGEARAAGVAMPISGQTFLAEHGSGATMNGRRQRVTETNSLALSRLEVDFSGPPHRDETLRRFSDLIRKAGQIRCHCAAVVGLCSIASGDKEAFVHVSLNPWDFAASQLIVEEAGGTTSRLDGSPLRLFDNRKGVVATNGFIQNEVIGMIRE